MFVLHNMYYNYRIFIPTHPAKMAMLDLQWTLESFIWSIIWEMTFFRLEKCLFPIIPICFPPGEMCKSLLYRGPMHATIEKNPFSNYKHWYLIQELRRVNPDRNIFSINVELTSTLFILYRGLDHHHHRILI